MVLRTSLFTLLLGLLMHLSTPVYGQDAAQSEQKERLAKLQAELVARQQVLQNSKASADELEGVLKQSELEIAKVAKALSNTKQSLERVEKEQNALQKEQATLKLSLIHI